MVRAMEWGAEGYQLWVSIEQSPESPVDTPQVASTHADHASSGSDTESDTTVRAPVKQRRKFDFLQMPFVKSPLTVNPCLVSSWVQHAEYLFNSALNRQCFPRKRLLLGRINV